MLEQSVGEWLESIGLQQYESKLLLNGFDDGFPGFGCYGFSVSL